MDSQEMRVQKRDGKLEEVSFDKILRRVKNLGSEATPPIQLNYSELIMKVIIHLHMPFFRFFNVS